ncbi:MAG: hypothetical protein ABSE90_01575 [Verrucomicrobiota bacterium]
MLGVGCWMFGVFIVFPAVVRAQTSLPDTSGTRSSVSGQFVVIGANPGQPPARLTVAAANADFVRLDPALLAVSAERVKQSLSRGLGIDPMTPWRGRIFLALHPAVTPDENVTIISTRFAGVWNYRVELPDVLSRTSLARAITGAVLLELANRDNPGGHSAEIPAWLTEGLAQQLLSDTPEMIMSPPDKLVNGLLANRSAIERGVDALAKARPVLRDQPALTFEQLSWPDDEQLNGRDGGVYRASAQLFVSDLLALRDGAKNLRAMLPMLPRCYNWQTAFRAAFAADFPRPVDVEKWWALQTVSFAARDAGPLWTPAARARAAISLQTVIGSFDSDRQTEILQTRLRDLELAHWRMAPQFAVLTDAYRRALAGYLGGINNTVSASRAGVKHPQPITSATSIVKRLDALDAQRRKMETAVKPEIQAVKLQ